MEKSRVNINFIGVAACILLSKVLGFFRDILIASRFGTRKLADVYLQIFGIPGLIFASIGMALSTVNIPNLTYYLRNKSREERNKYISSLFMQVTAISAVVSLIGIVAAPLVTRLILPGLSSEMAGIAQTLTRIMFPTLLFITSAYIAAGILQVHGYFLIAAIISIPFNLIIITTLFICRDNPVVLGYVTTTGWALQFLIQLPVLVKEKYRFTLRADFKNKHIERMYSNLVSILLGNAALQLCLLVDRIFASNLEEGSTSALSYGGSLFVTITSIFVVAMSTVMFPELSKQCLDRNFEKVRDILNQSFKTLFFILVPFMLIVIMYHRQIIQLVYERGSFTERSTLMTSSAFLLYSFCIAGYVSQEVFNRVYYALKSYRVPMVLSIICITVNFIMDVFLYRPFGIKGIAASTAFSFIIYTLLMGMLVKKEIGVFLGNGFGGYLLRLAVPSVAMLGVFLLFEALKPEGILRSLILPVAAGGALYLVISYFTKALKDIVLKKV